ncbi:SCO3870 family protein [Streptomyces sp. NPDC056682]
MALWTAFGFIALQLCTSGYEPYVRDVALASVLMHFTRSWLS